MQAWVANEDLKNTIFTIRNFLQRIEIEKSCSDDIKKNLENIFIRLDALEAQVETQANLRDHAQLQIIYQGSPLGIIELSSELKILRSNLAYQKMLGYSEEELIGKSMIDLTYPEDRERIRSKAEEIAKTGGLFKRFEKRYVHRNGSVVDACVTSRFVEEGNGQGYFISVIEDITELKRSQEEADTVFKNMSEGVIILGEAGDAQKFNPEAIKILGLTESQLRGQNPIAPKWKTVKEDGTPYSKEEYPATVALRTNQPVRNRIMGLTVPSGEELWIKLNAVPFQSSGERKVACSFTDITELVKQRSNDLRNRQILKALEKSAIVAFTDVKGRITQVNDNFCKISGYKLDELLGKDHRIINSGAHSKSFFQNLWTTISSGKTWTGDLENRSKSGESYFVRTVITPICNLQGQIEQYMSIQFDVTLQKLAEKASEESRAFLKTILDYIPGPVYSKEPSGKFIFVNKEYYEAVAVAGDVGTMTVRDIFPAEVAEAITENDQKIIESKKAVQYREEIPHRDGGMRVYDTYKFPVLDAKGEVLAVTGISFDITARTELQKQVELERSKSVHNAKLASLGEMSAGIAHEINNPLAIILGNVSHLAKFKDDPEKFNSKVESIKKATGRIEKIVRGLKKFSRSSEKSIYKLEEMEEIIGEVLVLTEAYAKRQCTFVSSTVQEGVRIMCDGVEIEQVLVNLINNGIDAVKDRPDKWVKINCFSNSEHVIVQVIDSGTGIPESIQKKLFQPFFSTKPVGEGTGLGLSIVKGILDQHKASIHLDQASSNTCFEIRFPKVEVTTLATQNLSTSGFSG